MVYVCICDKNPVICDQCDVKNFCFLQVQWLNILLTVVYLDLNFCYAKRAYNGFGTHRQFLAKKKNSCTGKMIKSVVKEVEAK